MISVIGSRCTSTSNIERSISSGFQPWDIVRLPCGSRSIARTLCPFSTSATPRFSVVVVLATPPFWFAKAMTRASAGPLSVLAREFGRGSNRVSAIVAHLSNQPSRVLLVYVLGHGPEMARAGHRLCGHFHAPTGHHCRQRRPPRHSARVAHLLHGSAVGRGRIRPAPRHLHVERRHPGRPARA